MNSQLTLSPPCPGGCCDRDAPASYDLYNDYSHISIDTREANSDELYWQDTSHPVAREVQGLFAGINYLNETEPQEWGDVLQEEGADGELPQSCYGYPTVRLSVGL